MPWDQAPCHPAPIRIWFGTAVFFLTRTTHVPMCHGLDGMVMPGSASVKCCARSTLPMVYQDAPILMIMPGAAYGGRTDCPSSVTAEFTTVAFPPRKDE